MKVVIEYEKEVLGPIVFQQYVKYIRGFLDSPLTQGNRKDDRNNMESN